MIIVTFPPPQLQQASAICNARNRRLCTMVQPPIDSKRDDCQCALLGHGHLSCVSYAGERAYNRRPHIYLYEDPMRNDIQLLSFYINKFKQEKAQSGGGATITEITKVASEDKEKVEDKPEITEITE